MFHPDRSFDLPTGDSLLAEFGIDPAAVREVAEDDRALRCPDRDALPADRPRTAFGIDTRRDRALHGAAPVEVPGPSGAFPPADQRWRRA